MKTLLLNICLVLLTSYCFMACREQAPKPISESFNTSEAPDTKLYPVWDSTYRVGYMNAKGEIVIPCQYFGGSIFSNNRAFVLVDVKSTQPGEVFDIPSGMWQMIDTKGHLLGLPFKSYEVPFFCGKLFMDDLGQSNAQVMPYMANYNHPHIGYVNTKSYIDTLGQWHTQIYPDLSAQRIESMIFYDSFYNSYSIKNKKQAYCTPFVSMYAIQKLSQRSILIDTAQNYIADLPDSLSFIESIHGNYLVCISGNYNEPKPNNRHSYRVVIDTKGRHYCSFRSYKSNKAVNDKILYHGKNNLVAYYEILNQKHVTSQSGPKYNMVVTLSDSDKYYLYHYIHSNILGNSIFIPNKNIEYSNLYNARLNLIHSDLIIINCIEGAELALVKLDDKIGYMNQYGQFVWSKPSSDYYKHIILEQSFVCSKYGHYISW